MVDRDALCPINILYQRMGESRLHCCKLRSYFLSPEQVSGLTGF